MFYVIEIQTYADTGAVIPYAHTVREDAEAQYHSLLAVAAKSAVLKHTVSLMGDTGLVLKSETYIHGGEE